MNQMRHAMANSENETALETQLAAMPKEVLTPSESVQIISKKT